MTDPNDDLADVLAPQPAFPAPQLREALLRQIERRLIRIRWLRRGVKAAAIAAVFLIGGMVGWFVRPASVSEPVPKPEPEVVVVPLVVPVIQPPVADAPGSPRVVVAMSASEAELRAEQTDDGTEAAKLYRTAGDTFLRDQDYANATRCYRLFLIRAGDNGLSSERDDSWLLTSLKNAAYKEKTHAPKTVD